MDLSALIQSAGQQYNVDPSLIHAVIQTESSGNPNAVGPQTQYGHAEGLGQFIPATAKSLGISNPFDPAQAVPGIAKLLSENLDRYGDVQKAISAYHGGTDPANWGPKTQAYVQKVAANYGGAQMPTQQQSQDLPGLPPVNGPQQGMVDPFAKFRGDANQQAQVGVPTNSQGMVDPFAKFRGDNGAAPASATPAVPPVMRAPQVPAANAQDLAMGGASPDVLSQLGQIGMAGAHGIGSMFNNAANFVERHLPFFPADIAARDTAVQAQADQKWKQQASPGEQAAAFVAPMLLPMGGAMAPGRAVSAGIARIAGSTAPTLGRIAGNIAGNAVTGGLMSTGTPIDPNQPTGPQDASHLEWGAGLGAALPALVSGGIGTGKWLGRNVAGLLAPVIDPRGYVGRGIANFLGDQAGDVANNIRSAPTYVPGYQPTASQIGGNVGLVATEKAAANADPNFKIALAQNGVNNNATLWNALDQVAGNKNDLDNLIAQRNTATTPLYNVAKQQNIPVDAPMTDLLARPAMQKAITRAQTGADNRNAGPILQTTSVPSPMGGSPSSLTTMNGAGAQRVKEAFDAMLMPENTNKLSSKEIGDIQDTRDAFMAWMEGHSDAFRQARQTYAAMSPPINSMQAAQQMSENLGGLGRSMDVNQNPVLTAPGYATAFSRALGNQEFGIEPAAQTQLENIGRELQRSTISNSLKSPGSDTAYNLAANGWLARNLYGPGFGGATGLGRGIAGLATALAGHPYAGMGVAAGLGKVGQTVGGRLNAQVSDLLLGNPKGLLPYLDARAAMPINPAPPVLGPLLQRQVFPSALGGLLRGGLINSQ